MFFRILNNTKNDIFIQTNNFELLSKRPLFSGISIIICLLIFIFIAVYSIVLYERDIPVFRTNLLTPFASIGVIIIITYIIYSFIGKKTTIFGSQIDTALIIYILFTIVIL